MASVTLKDYEAILIADPGLEGEALTALKTRFGEMVSRQGGQVVESVVLGKRRLGYRIRNRSEGIYLQMKLKMPPEGVDPLKKTAGTLEPLLRLMVVCGSNASAMILGG